MREAGLHGPFSKQFLEWWAEHEPLCNKNYDGSSPMMEAEGALRVFGGQYQRTSFVTRT